MNGYKGLDGLKNDFFWCIFDCRYLATYIAREKKKKETAERATSTIQADGSTATTSTRRDQSRVEGGGEGA